MFFGISQDFFFPQIFSICGCFNPWGQNPHGQLYLAHSKPSINISCSYHSSVINIIVTVTTGTLEGQGVRWGGQEKAELGQHLLRIYCVFRPAPGLRGPRLLLGAALLRAGRSPPVKWAGQQGWGQRPDSCPARKQIASQCQGSAIEWPPPLPRERPRGALAEEQGEEGNDGRPSLAGEGTRLSGTWSFVYDNVWSPCGAPGIDGAEARQTSATNRGRQVRRSPWTQNFNRCPK